METSSALIYIVGAGPGDPELLTVGAERILRQADFVVLDYLVSDEIREIISEKAEQVLLKHGVQRQNLEDIFQLLAEKARSGKTVVHLKGGDPGVFARLAEEITFFRKEKIDFRIFPGISSASAAAAYVECPLTDAEEASAVTFFTGKRRRKIGENGDRQNMGESFEETLEEENPRILAGSCVVDGSRTLVIYMGVKTVKVWTSELLQEGMSPEIPAVIIQNVSRGNQKTWRGTLGTLVEIVEEHGIRPPAIFILGNAVKNTPERNYFESRPLFGKTVLVTRAAAQTHEVAEKLQKLGAQVRIQPVISISPAKNPDPLRMAIHSLENFDWIIFSSTNGVRFFMEELLHLGYDLRKFGQTKIAVMGAGTAAAVEEFFLKPDRMPEVYNAEEMAKMFLKDMNEQEYLRPPRFLIARASRGREVLAESLIAAGGNVTQVVTYESENVTAESPDFNMEIREEMEAGKINWVMVTSSAIAESAVKLFGEALRKTKLVSISSLTSKMLEKYGFSPAAEAKEATIDGVIRALCENKVE
ncbi:MAG: uroporphyrinogen-III C-methyltransferase [Planctomycetia bacterium]|nr:uroporphyrinogen-III C-methyltransferase [Planctomycetia bacterium]